MKTFLSLAFVLAACGLLRAQNEKTIDPVGTWKCEYQIGDQKRTLEMTIEKAGAKFVGTMTWPDQKNEKLMNVALKDDTLKFSAVRKFMDKEFPLEFTMSIAGDMLKGKASAEFGGQKNEFDLSGKREKKAK